MGFLFILSFNTAFSADLGEKVKYLYKYIDEGGNLISQSVQFEVKNYDPFINAILLSKIQLDDDGRITKSEKWYPITNFPSKRTIQAILDQCYQEDKVAVKIRDSQTGEEKEIFACKRWDMNDFSQPFPITPNIVLIGDTPIFGIVRAESFQPRMVYQIIPQSTALP